RYDNAFKPDVVAPGVSVNTLLSSGSYGPGSGTSFSAPIVAGVAATLISALKKLSLTYTPGTIKGALIKTATPILDPSSSYEPYPWWEQGAGLINATAALEYLISTTKTNSTLPDSIVAYPNKIPYSPIKKIFLGQQMGYNISLISSGEFTISIQQSNNSIKFISFPSTLKILDTTLLPIWFNIPNDATPGLYSFHLMINSNRNGYSTQIEITFQLLKPNASILIDFTHSGIVNEIFSVNTVNRLDDPWTASFLWGRYREFYIDMVDLNVSISLARSSNLENLTILEQYNILLIANPGTSLTGTFTDWWNDPVNFPSSTLITNVNSFTNSELSTLKSYVTNHGGNIQIFTSYPSMENITEVNRLLDVFNLTYIPTYVSQKVTIQNSSIFNLTNSIAIDYVGGLVNQSSGKYFEGHLVTPQELTQPIFAYWTSSTNGSLFVSGSAFFIELGLAEVSSHNYYENNLFYQILIANATKNYVIENPPFHPPSSSNSLISSSSTLSSISSFSSTIPTSSLMLLPFIIGLGIVYLSRKYRVK
ncbi:MAG: S8 family serine peptidase, partial [Candidatus Thorarchaeota archaeon]